MAQHFLLASDFDQTLSFNDSGVVLSELIGFHGFHDKVKGLAEMNLVQQGAELSYLILHDPDFRRVRRDHLVETGKRIRLKHDVALFARALDNLAEGYKFHFNVISAAPQEIIQTALEGIVPPDQIFGTRFRYNEATGEDVIGRNDALERRLDNFLGRGGDDVEMKFVTLRQIVEGAREKCDVVFQADALAGLNEMVAADAAEIRVMENQIAKLRALLDEVHLRQSLDLVVEPVKTDELAQHDSRVVEAQRLVKITGQ